MEAGVATEADFFKLNVILLSPNDFDNGGDCAGLMIVFRYCLIRQSERINRDTLNPGNFRRKEGVAQTNPLQITEVSFFLSDRSYRFVYDGMTKHLTQSDSDPIRNSKMLGTGSSFLFSDYSSRE